MPRKKENKRSDGYYEVKAVVDHTFDGKPITKAFIRRNQKQMQEQKQKRISST